MTTHTHTGRWAHRLGWGAGQAWRWFAGRDRQARQWLVAQGFSAGVAKAMLWIVKLGVLAVLLYAVTWLAVLLVFAFVAAWVTRNADWNDEQGTEWGTGASGFGLYRGDIRIDVGDPYEDAE